MDTEQIQDRGQVTAAEIAFVLGVPYRTVRRWCNLGLLQAAQTLGGGKGRGDRYDESELEVARMIEELRGRGGLEYVQIAAVVSHLRADGAASRDPGWYTQGNDPLSLRSLRTRRARRSGRLVEHALSSSPSEPVIGSPSTDPQHQLTLLAS